MSRSVFVWYGLGLALLFGRAARLADSVVHPVPTHFGFDGVPNATGPASSLYVPPALAAVLTILLLGLGAALPRLAASAPDLINLPRKKLFLSLPSEARVRCAAPLVSLLAFLPLPLCGLFLWLLEESARFGIEGPHGARATLPLTPATLPIAAMLIATFVYAGRAGRMVRAEAAAVGPAVPSR
jgi:hypothetical protein